MKRFVTTPNYNNLVVYYCLTSPILQGLSETGSQGTRSTILLDHSGCCPEHPLSLSYRLELFTILYSTYVLVTASTIALPTDLPEPINSFISCLFFSKYMLFEQASSSIQASAFSPPVKSFRRITDYGAINRRLYGLFRPRYRWGDGKRCWWYHTIPARYTAACSSGHG